MALSAALDGGGDEGNSGGAPPRTRAGSIKASLKAKRALLKKQREEKALAGEGAAKGALLDATQHLDEDGQELSESDSIGGSGRRRSSGPDGYATVDRWKAFEADDEALDFGVIYPPLERPFKLGIFPVNEPEPGEQRRVLVVPGSEWEDSAKIRHDWTTKQLRKQAFCVERDSNIGLCQPAMPPMTRKLLDQGVLHDRALREAATIAAEEGERREWDELGLADADEQPHTDNRPLKRKMVVNLSIEPDPALPAPIRRETPPSEEPPLPPAHLARTLRYPVVGSGPEARLAMSEGRCELRIAVSSLALHDHPLFREEDVLYSELRTLYGRYCAHMEGHSEGLLRGRLRSLLEQVDKLSCVREPQDDREDLTSSCGAELARLHKDALQTIKYMTEEEREHRSLHRAVYDLWLELEEARYRAGFTSTPAKLHVREVARPAPANSEKEYTSLEEDIAIMEALEERFFQEEDQNDAPASSAYSPLTTTGMSPSRHTRRKLRARARVKNVLDEARRILLAPRAQESSLVLRLGTDEPLSPESPSMPSEESMRRARIQSLKLYCTVYVNERRINSTPVRSLEWPAMVVSFRHMTRLRIIQSPSSVLVKVFLRRSLLPDVELSSIWVPVPGTSMRNSGANSSCLSEAQHNVHSLAPRAQWCHWASARPMSIRGDTTAAARRVRGSLLVGVEWATEAVDVSGQATSSGNTIAPLLPANSIRELGEDTRSLKPWELLRALWDADYRHKLRAVPLVGSRLFASATSLRRNAGASAGEKLTLPWEAPAAPATGADLPIPDFAREADFLRLLPSETEMDPNDPENVRLIRLRELAIPKDGTPIQDRFMTWEAEQALLFRSTRPGAAGGPSATYPYNNYSQWREPLRHTLLRLREAKPAQFGNKPIPLTESEIRDDDEFEAMLAQEVVRTRQRRSSRGGPRMDMDDPHAAAADAAAYADDLLRDKRCLRLGVDRGRFDNFLRKVQESRIIQSRRSSQHMPSFGNIVQEVPLPDLSLDLMPLLQGMFGARKRALKPHPQQRTANSVQIDSCRLLVQVIKARNVPLRTFTVASEGAGEEVNHLALNDPDMEARHVGGRTVNTFAQVRFQNARRATHVYEGSAPLWKETVELPFQAPMNSFSPASLAQVRDVVHVSLFDRVEYDDRARGGYFEDEAASRIENRFLGTLAIPFQTIYMEGRVEGLFRLRTPPANMGYETGRPPAAGDVAAADAGTAEGEDGLGSLSPSRLNAPPMATSAGSCARLLSSKGDQSTYIYVLAMLDPMLLRPQNLRCGNNLCVEDKSLQQYARRWTQRLRQGERGWSFVEESNSEEEQQRASVRGRSVEIFVPTLSGEDVLATRFLVPQEPPPQITTIREAVHFVRLIPFLDDWQAFSGDSDMWCTSAQFLDILAGDWEEHAILLHNYILWLVEHDEVKAGRSPAGGKRSDQPKRGSTEVYIVVGRGRPEGDTVYVMVQDVDSFGDVSACIFWNASTGDGYDHADSRCPLHEVGCVIGQYNIWANTQASASPWTMSFDLRNTFNWRPFFSAPLNPLPSPPLPTVQAPIVYRPTDSTFVFEAEELIRETLKREIRRWRSKRSHTAFNADVSHRLAEALPLLEQQALGKATFDVEEHQHRIASGMRSRELVGFPLQTGFSCVDDIVGMVKATSIHECKHPEAQFALAVLCVPYSNNVLSVWIYVATITPTI